MLAPTGCQTKTAIDWLFGLALARSTRNSSVRPSSMVKLSVVFLLPVKVGLFWTASVMVNWPPDSTTLPPRAVKSCHPIFTPLSKLSKIRPLTDRLAAKAAIVANRTAEAKKEAKAIFIKTGLVKCSGKHSFNQKFSKSQGLSLTRLAGGRIPVFGCACWRAKQRVYRALINTLLQRGVIRRSNILNRFSGFHRPKPLKRLRFNGLACTQLKQGVNETCHSRCSKTGMRAARGLP